jgi:5'-nucleotidase
MAAVSRIIYRRAQVVSSAAMLRVLLTNDDGIDAEGLQALRRELGTLEDIQLAVIAPDGNRSATARSITFRRPLWVQEVPFDDGTVGYACDGTPVDCVRLASLGLIDGFEPDLIVSGINHGANLGDDITYSGTVAAALEGVVLGIPGIAVSQQSSKREMDFRLGHQFDFSKAAAFTARVVDRLDDVPLPTGTLLNINVPAGDIGGVEVAHLGKRIYRDRLDLIEEESGRKLYRVYGDSPVHDDEPGTDLAAVSAGQISVTPLHFDLTAEHGMEALRAFDLAHLLDTAEDEALD